MDIRDVAKLLGGDVSGRSRVICPGPGHSPKDRSLSVTFEQDSFIVHSFAGDDWRACRDHVSGILKFGGSASDGTRRIPHVSGPAATAAPDRTNQALAIWNEARAISGSPAERYLLNRRVSYQGSALRWHPACPFGKGTRVGCMVAIVTDIATGKPMAIHRTAISGRGEKLNHLGSNGRLALGPLAGGAIKLYQIDGPALAIGEGIETCLTVRSIQTLETMPVWSLLNAGQLSAFPVIRGITSLWVAMDNDDAGEQAMRKLAVRMTAENVETIVLAPVQRGRDLNDVEAWRDDRT